MIFLGTVYSCKKAKGTDKELFDMATETGGFTWYKNSDILLDKSSGSGHPQPFLRTRYNAIAATQLDADGKVIPGSLFPEGSLVVKELINNSSAVDRYAILYKNASSHDADANGWVWGYINADGIVAEPASNQGAACISCHLQDEHIDYMLMNKYFP
ncbi:MAG: cytochrome P460 family protein [Flavobacteriales bacterium]|nr:cytochrome P460 family protein [Flavobacteriales bacterium]